MTNIYNNRTYLRRAVPVSPPLPFQTPGEEIANAVLHGLGVLLGVVGLAALTLRGGGYLKGAEENLLDAAAYRVFMVTMIAMFLSSALYHGIQHEKAKRVLRILDHAGIYLFIAGTYTPFCLLGLKGVWGWVCFGIEWFLAITGIILYTINCGFLKKVELWVYLLMGWAIVISWFRLVQEIPLSSVVLLVAGGVAYTLGTIWYAKPTRRGSHVIWHGFVLAGAIGHWWSIWFIKNPV
ncbi:MAG: hemolysin III family protein [Treponema sp.]|jgi:hemolysin III|nr:hemolysin III family protein [Treponema sp.]